MRRRTTPIKSLRKEFTKQQLPHNKTVKRRKVPREKSNKEISEEESTLVRQDSDHDSEVESVTIAQHIIGESKQGQNEKFSPLIYWRRLARDGGKLLRIAFLILLSIFLLAAIAKAAEVILGIKIFPIVSIMVKHDFLSFCLYTLRMTFKGIQMRF